MIKLKSLLKLRDLKWTDINTPKAKHIKRLSEAPSVIKNPVIPKVSPPENDSRFVRKEIDYIIDIHKNRKFNKEQVDLYDTKMIKAYKNFLADNNLDYDLDYLDKIVNDSNIHIMKLKYKYNRPRPKQIAEFYGIPFNPYKLKTSKTPSYPSGHASQSYLLSEILSRNFPKHSVELRELAKNITLSRIKGGVHFPSDSAYGIKVAQAMLEVI